MMGSRVNKDSKNIVKLVKPGTIGAEIGVWWGNTSYYFFMQQPKHLYLVDPWSVEPYKGTTEFEMQEYFERYSKVTGSKTEAGFQKYYDKVYEDVSRRFDPYPTVSVVRQTSDEFFANYTDEPLDWIYIDGSHAYEQVLVDLENALKIMKPGGMILGDDYKWGDRFGKPGVTKAVNEFVKKHKLKIKQHGVVQFEIGVPE